MLFRFFTWMCVIVPLASLAGCSTQSDPWEGKPGPPRVVTSFPPLYCFVKNVAGAQAGLITLCSTTGPHHYQYNVQDLLYLRKADLFFANGLTLDEQFTKKLYDGAAAPRPSYVCLGDELPHDLLLHTGEADRKHEHADGTVCEHGEHDPHVWLGIPQSLAMVKRIRDELKKAAPDHAAAYDANAAAYVAQLKKLHADGSKLLAAKKNRKLITFHESLAYFAKSFGLTVVDVIMDGPGNEPGGPRMAKLLNLIVKEDVKVLAVEPQYPKETAAKVLMDELRRKGVEGVSLVEVDPLETATEEDLQDPEWYVRKMRENLDNLARALP